MQAMPRLFHRAGREWAVRTWRTHSGWSRSKALDWSMSSTASRRRGPCWGVWCRMGASYPRGAFHSVSSTSAERRAVLPSCVGAANKSETCRMCPRRVPPRVAAWRGESAASRCAPSTWMVVDSARRRQQVGSCNGRWLPTQVSRTFSGDPHQQFRVSSENGNELRVR